MIAVVCNDAGGAEVLSAYLKTVPDPQNYCAFVAGPAAGIFQKKNVPAQVLPEGIAEAIALVFGTPGVEKLVAGIGWSTTKELDLILAAKEHDIHTIVYLDHWVNYRERFGYPRAGWEKNLPDEFFVGDRYAEQLAKEFFSGTPVTLIPNRYFDEIKQAYTLHEEALKRAQDGILFLCEPISAPINSFGDHRPLTCTEFSVLEDFLRVCVEQHIEEPIRVRLHPSESRDKYDAVIAQFQDKLRVTKSEERDLLADFARVKKVAGMESMALVMAVICDKKVISFLPNCGLVCPLPHKEIVRVTDSRDLAPQLV